LNEWLYHSFVPNFYHLELKQDFDHWKGRKLEKGQLYKDVVFICDSKKSVRYSDAIGKNQKYIYSYEVTQNWNPKRDIIHIPNNFYLHPTKITKSYSASLTCLLDIISRFNYKYIITYGIDLHNSLYFWTGKKDIYGEVFQDTNKNYPPEHPHNTEPVKLYIKEFYKKFVRPRGTRMYVGHEDTALFGSFKKINICDLINK
jgi:hypothetical protein